MMAGAPPIPSGNPLPEAKKPAAPPAKTTPAAKAEKKTEPPADPAAAAKHYLDAMTRALGGEEKLKALHSLHIDYLAVINMLAQSERPEGPYLQRFQQISEDADLTNRRYRFGLQERWFAQPKWSDNILIADASAMAALSGEQQLQAPQALFQDFNELWMFRPERLAATALEGKNLKTEDPLEFQGSPHVTVAFTTASGLPARILISKDTTLPSAVEWTTTRPSDSEWYVWGDIHMRLRFGLWQLDTGGILYPLEWELQRNGRVHTAWCVTGMTFNPTLADSQLTLDGTVAKMFQAFGTFSMDNVELGLPNSPTRSLTSKVVYIPGHAGVTLIHQDDGVVVIDPVISNGYTRKIIEEAGWRFKDVPLKAVVSTSDSWDGNGGLREYVAAGVPVYALQINKPFIEGILNSPHTLHPDSLAQRPKAPVLNWVPQRTSVGAGATKIELIPVRGSAGERLMMVYFPEQKALYASALVNKLPDKSYYMPSYLGEVIQAVQREHLDVETVFGMRLDPVQYSDIVQAYNRVAAPPTAAK